MRKMMARRPSGDRGADENSDGMFAEAELRLMSREQRARLRRTLAALDRPNPLNDPRLRLRRRLALTVVIACCLFLIAWICVLAIRMAIPLVNPTTIGRGINFTAEPMPVAPSTISSTPAMIVHM